MGTRELILGATTPPQEVVDLTELAPGATQLVRGMTGSERDAFEASMFEGRGKKRDVNMANMRAKLVARTAIEPDGSRTFTDADAEALGAVRADVLDKLFTVGQRLSGLSERDVDELGKPSPSPTVSAPSSSVSRGN